MASPNPVPPCSVEVDLPAWLSSSNTPVSYSVVITLPVFDTALDSMPIPSCSHVSISTVRRPFRVGLQALLSRFECT